MIYTLDKHHFLDGDKMIDQHNITNYKRTDRELQEFLTFCVAVAGKKSDTTAQKVNELSDFISEMFVENPYYQEAGNRPETGVIHYLVNCNDGVDLLRTYRFGKYNQWAKFLDWWGQLLKYLDGFCIGDWLREASVYDLEQIPSVGKKTARFFKLHSDPEADCVPLDTHILKFVRDKHCYDPDYIPKTTPTSIFTYASIEGIAKVYMKDYMTQNKMKTLAQADQAIWSSYVLQG